MAALAYRFGWFLYWVCLALIGTWALVIFGVVLNFHVSGLADATPAVWAITALPMLALYGLGRGLRYVFSGE
jgi:hypothetical protein